MVRSIEFMFSCAPLSTSCSRMLASRRRSNSAVVVGAQHGVRLHHLGHGRRGGLLRLLDRALGRPLQILERPA